MTRRALLCMLLFADFALGAEPLLHVRGVVRDDLGRPVKDVHVSVYLEGRSFAETKTDARGEFTAEAPKGAHVTVMDGDQMGHAVIKGKEVVVKMQQMPL